MIPFGRAPPVSRVLDPPLAGAAHIRCVLHDQSVARIGVLCIYGTISVAVCSANCFQMHVLLTKANESNQLFKATLQMSSTK